MLRILAVAILAAVLTAGIAFFALYRQLIEFRDTPFGSDAEKVVEIPPGSSVRQIMRLLAHGGVISDEKLAWRYLRLLRRDKRPMRAGEYAFTGPTRPDDVLEKIYRGEVKTYHFTVPEGLRMEEIAAIIERGGLGKVSELVPLMHDPGFARELGVPFDSLEGYLFPDTYTFTKGPKPRAVLGAMVARLREAYRQAEAQRLPEIRLTEGEAVTLASIIEKETGRADERPKISCVFHNRLRTGMRLQTDPTVMYATMLRNGGRWSQNITKADLLAAHPYNTYSVAGLPPGPIASAGQAALDAALHPSECADLYFVSRNDGSHVFCPDLHCHEAAVRKWQIEYFRPQRAAAEPAVAKPPVPRASGHVRKRGAKKKPQSNEQAHRARDPLVRGWTLDQVVCGREVPEVPRESRMGAG
jgi:UPF0755 protein